MPTVSRRHVTVGLGLSLWSGRAATAATASADKTTPLVLTAARPPDPPDGLDGSEGATSGYNGSVPGPTIRIKAGEEVVVRLVNRLAAPTSIHWHGVRLANAMDGAAGLTQAAVAPGASFDYRFVAPDAGTYWYHPDAGAEAASQIDSGLFGLLVVDEEHPDFVDRDLSMVVGRGSSSSQEIALRQNERLRLRLVNAATARIASLAFGGLEPMIVALDGHPVNEAFAPAGRRLDLAPGGRADLVFDGTIGDGERAGIAMRVGDGIVEIARFVRTGTPARPAPLPPPKAASAGGLPDDIALGRARRADVVLPSSPGGAGFGANAGAPLLSATRGEPVTLAFVNQSDLARVVHVHGHALRILHALDDGWEPFWLDTLVVPAGETVHVAFVADNPGKWRIACRDIEGDGAITRWFEVM